MSIGIFEKNKDSIYANSKRQSSYNNNNKDRELTFHVVKDGEYLGLIAKKHQCSVSDLKKWNYLKTDRLRTGQKLRVYEIAGNNKAKGTTTKNITTNGSDKEYSYYTIKKGDTLWEIAQRYEGVSMEDLKDANSQWNFHNLKTGTKIKIPR